MNLKLLLIHLKIISINLIVLLFYSCSTQSSHFISFESSSDNVQILKAQCQSSINYKNKVVVSYVKDNKTIAAIWEPSTDSIMKIDLENYYPFFVKDMIYASDRGFQRIIIKNFENQFCEPESDRIKNYIKDRSLVCLTNEMILLKCSDGLIAYDDTNRIWQRPFDIFTFATIDSTRILLQTSDSIFILDKFTGEKISIFNKKLISEDIGNAPNILYSITDSTLIAFNESNNIIYKVNYIGIQLLWSKSIDDNFIFQLGPTPISIANLHLQIEDKIVVATCNNIYIINCFTGEYKTIKLKGIKIVDFFVLNKKLYILDKLARLHSFSLLELEESSNIVL